MQHTFPGPWWAFPTAAGLAVASIALWPVWATNTTDLDALMLPSTVPWLLVAVFGLLIGFHVYGAGRRLLLLAAGFLAVAALGTACIAGLAPRAEDIRMLGGLHLPLLLGAGALGAYLRTAPGEDAVDAVRHAASVAALTAGLLAGGGVLVALTVGMLGVLQVPETSLEFVLIHVVVWGLSSVVYFAHALWVRFPTAFDRILPAVARLFIPLFLVLEVVFLVALLFRSPAEGLAQNRELLLVFNVLLLAVVGLLVLRASFAPQGEGRGAMLATGVAGLALVADACALWAIGTRIGEWGFSVNRVAVLGANVALFAALGAYVVASVRAADREGARRKVLNRVLWGAAVWAAVWAVGVPVVGGGDEIKIEVEDEIEVGGVGVDQITH